MTTLDFNLFLITIFVMDCCMPINKMMFFENQSKYLKIIWTLCKSYFES